MGDGEGFLKALIAYVLGNDLKASSFPKFIEVVRDTPEVGKEIWAVHSPQFPFFSI